MHTRICIHFDRSFIKRVYNLIKELIDTILKYQFSLSVSSIMENDNFLMIVSFGIFGMQRFY